MSRRALLVLVVVDVAVSAVVLTTHHLQVLPEVPYKGFVNANLVGLSVLAATLAVIRARHHGGLVAWLLAAVLGLLALGEVLCLTQDWLLPDVDWPLDAYDLVWLAARLVLLALLLLARGGERPPVLRSGAVWAAASVAVLAGACWTVCPLLQASYPDATGPFAIPMVLADLAALVLAAAAFHRGGLGHPPLSWGVAGVAVLLLTDLLLYREVTGVAGPFVFGEMGYFAGYLVAAWVGASRRIL